MSSRRAAIGLLLLSGWSSAQMGGDLQAQIVYAAHSEDVNALASIQAGLRARIAADGAASLRYHLAHADYRQAQLDAYARPREAAQAAGECIEQLKPLLKRDVADAEALLLQAACYATRAGLGSVGAVLDRRRATQRLDEALRADPRNPRALLFAALRDLDTAGSEAAARAAGRAQLQAAAELFTQASATGAEAPGWGDADAWLALGLELQRAGDLLGARNWIERALIASPDDKAAQRARAALAGR